MFLQITDMNCVEFPPDGGFSKFCLDDNSFLCMSFLIFIQSYFTLLLLQESKYTSFFFFFHPCNNIELLFVVSSPFSTHAQTMSVVFCYLIISIYNNWKQLWLTAIRKAGYDFSTTKWCIVNLYTVDIARFYSIRLETKISVVHFVFRCSCWQQRLGAFHLAHGQRPGGHRDQIRWHGVGVVHVRPRSRQQSDR